MHTYMNSQCVRISINPFLIFGAYAFFLLTPDFFLYSAPVECISNFMINHIGHIESIRNDKSVYNVNDAILTGSLVIAFGIIYMLVVSVATIIDICKLTSQKNLDFARTDNLFEIMITSVMAMAMFVVPYSLVIIFSTENLIPASNKFLYVTIVYIFQISSVFLFLSIIYLVDFLKRLTFLLIKGVS